MISLSLYNKRKLVVELKQSQSSQSSTITHYVCPAEFRMRCTTGLEFPSWHHH